MKKNELVSVIIPAYNCEKWIEASIESAIKQTYQHLEIIVVNNGSLDGTDKVLEKFKNNNQISIYKTRRLGASGARNLGVSYARGNYIAFLDADDLWHPLKIEKQLNYFKNNSGCKLLLTNVIVIDQNGKQIKVYNKKLPKNKKQQVIKLFQNKITMNTPTILVKKDVFEEFNGFNEILIHREDHFFLMTVANTYGLHLIEEPLVYRRIWEGSMSFDYKFIEIDSNNIIEFYKKTRYPFLELSLQRFPFLRAFGGYQMAKYYNMVGMRLFRNEFMHEASMCFKLAISYNFRIEYLLKFILANCPSSFRNIIIKSNDQVRNQQSL